MVSGSPEKGGGSVGARGHCVKFRKRSKQQKKNRRMKFLTSLGITMNRMVLGLFVTTYGSKTAQHVGVDVLIFEVGVVGMEWSGMG